MRRSNPAAASLARTPTSSHRARRRVQRRPWRTASPLAHEPSMPHRSVHRRRLAWAFVGVDASDPSRLVDTAEAALARPSRRKMHRCRSRRQPTVSPFAVYSMGPQGSGLLGTNPAPASRTSPTRCRASDHPLRHGGARSGDPQPEPAKSFVVSHTGGIRQPERGERCLTVPCPVRLRRRGRGGWALGGHRRRTRQRVRGVRRALRGTGAVSTRARRRSARAWRSLLA